MEPTRQSLRVAIIDRDSSFEQVLTRRMHAAGWELFVHHGPLPVSRLVSMRLHAVVIDPVVLGDQAWAFLGELCEALPSLGVLVCTQGSSVTQRVRGLQLGADDWLTKPCHPVETMARLEAIVRRHRRGTAPKPESGPEVYGELEIRPDQFQAFAAGRSVELTRREFELLSALAGARGRALEREEIYERVWGYAMARGDRSVDVFVRKLRQKLERASTEWSYIHTHFGVGYRFEAEPLTAEAERTIAADEAPRPVRSDDVRHLLSSPEPS